MKTNHCFNYEAPETVVLRISFEAPMLTTSSVGNSSSESFQDESEYESIW
ncbi:MAG: hypothetical protein J5835_05870 [Bacteroidales bacterium]|nr:hypothetical protein [Bacteroidales bacterium]